MDDDKEICREILTIAEQMYHTVTSNDHLDDTLVSELREQGKEMDRLADQLS